MSTISLFPSLIRPEPPPFFKLEDAQPPKRGCYYSCVERFMNLTFDDRYDAQVVLMLLIDGRTRWVNAPPINRVTLNSDGMLCLACGPMLIGEPEITVVFADIRDDEGYDLMPLCWRINQRLFIGDTLNLTYGIKSKSFLEPTSVWGDSIHLEINGQNIHMTR